MIKAGFKTAIFDFDGTLVDSMWVWDNLLIDFLARHGHDTPEYILREVMHMTITQSSAYVAREFDLPMSDGEIRDEWTEMVFDSYSKEVRCKAGAAEYLEKLKSLDVKTGIATACSKELCEACLKANGIEELIDSVTYADEVGVGKGSPRVYLEALKRLGTEAADSMVYEDILVALRTVKSIGARVTIVEDEGSRLDRELLIKEADLYIRDFTELLNY